MFSALNEFGWSPIKESENIVGLNKGGKNITLEPGNQIELSGEKLNNIHEACAESYDYLFELKQVTKKLNINIDKKTFEKKLKDLKELPKLVEQTLLIDNKIQTISGTFNEAKVSMFLGRGYSYPIALEGALKLKELAYVHAEGYPAGEMKHGPLALIEEGMPVVVLAPRDEHYKKTISNMQEVIARGAKVLLITNKSKDEVVSENIWETIEVENTNDDLLPFLLTIPLQKLAYYSALKKGYDIDKPRNLAKSVTVE